MGRHSARGSRRGRPSLSGGESKSSQRPRPRALARYMATSALRSRYSGRSMPPEQSAMPMLAELNTS